MVLDRNLERGIMAGDFNAGVARALAWTSTQQQPEGEELVEAEIRGHGGPVALLLSSRRHRSASDPTSRRDAQEIAKSSVCTDAFVDRGRM